MRAAIRRKEGPEPVGPLAVAQATIEVKRATGRLLPHVDSYFLYRCDAEEFERTERVDLGQIRFLIEGEGEITYPDGHVERSKPIMVSGPGTAAAHYKLRGPVTCFGVTLRAVGWKALIGLPANKFTDHNIDGSKLFCERAPALLQQLRGMSTLDQMISAFAPLLIMRQEEVKPVPDPHFPFLEAVREWAASEAPTIDELYAVIGDTSGLGERQVQRLCLEYFGSSPAKLKRKFRAIRAAMQIYQGAPMSVVVGPFADQSHMINEVKHFTGHTPTSLRSGIDPVLAVTLGDADFHFLPEVFPEEVDGRRN